MYFRSYRDGRPANTDDGHLGAKRGEEVITAYQNDWVRQQAIKALAGDAGAGGAGDDEEPAAGGAGAPITPRGTGVPLVTFLNNGRPVPPTLRNTLEELRTDAETLVIGLPTGGPPTTPRTGAGASAGAGGGFRATRDDDPKPPEPAAPASLPPPPPPPSGVGAPPPPPIIAIAAPAPAAPDPTKPRWVALWDVASGFPYYHDTHSWTTQWEAPEGVDVADAAQVAPYMHVWQPERWDATTGSAYYQRAAGEGERVDARPSDFDNTFL